MTGIEDYNFPAFNDAAEQLRSLGYFVESPAEHGVVEGADWADYMSYDLTRLGRCGIIYLLPGWTKSKGAIEERRIADFLGMVVRYAPKAEQSDALHPPISTWPTWSNWIALSPNGEWWYFANKPKVEQGGWMPEGQWENSHKGEGSNAWAAMVYGREV